MRGSRSPSVKYVVLAASTADALHAIRKECGHLWTVQFLPEYILPRDAIERFNLVEGRAQILDD